MERLTARDNDGNVFFKDSNGYMKCNYSKEMDRLAQYEDTGLTPEEIRENSIAFGNDRAWFFEQKEKMEKEITSLKEQLKEYKDAEEQGLLIGNKKITAEDLRKIFSQIYNNQCNCLEETNIVYQTIIKISKEYFLKRREEIEKQIPIDADPVTADYIRVNK